MVLDILNRLISCDECKKSILVMLPKVPYLKAVRGASGVCAVLF